MADQAITEGNALVVDCTVTNRGDATGTHDITLEVDGTTEDTISSVQIAPGDTYRDVLFWNTESGDAQGTDYDACVVAQDREDCITVNVS